jgi:hypothetical protein
MRTMPVLFILIVVGYVGFELYGLHRAKERMDPVTILDKFHMADRATSRCGEPEGDDLERFQRNLGLAERRATRALAERSPDATGVEIAEMLAARREASVQEVDGIVEAKGCGDREIYILLRRFEIWARHLAG